MKTAKKILTIATVAIILVCLNQAAYAAGSWNGTVIKADGLNKASLNYQSEANTGIDTTASSTPEPALLLLFGCGLIGLCLFGRKKMMVAA